jgi:outer membrane protein W
MSKTIYQNSIILFILFIISGIYGQGMPRSTGVGLRISYWNILRKPTIVHSNENTGQVNVEVGGAGAYLCFISRAYQNFFFELQLGAIGGVTVNTDEFNNKNDVYVESIIPLLFGLRYDFLSSRITGSIQPYFSLGAGPYWLNKVKTIEQSGMEQKTEVSSDLLYGGYLGAGTNILISSWFALNFDIRYQFVEFQYDQGYSGPEFIMGFNFMWGKKREIFEIKDIKLIIKEIYPAYHQFYSVYPVALVTIKNILSHPFDVRVICKIRELNTRPTTGEFYHIKGGETYDIPVNLILGEDFQSWNKENNVAIDFQIEIKYTTTLKKDLSLPILIHSSNAWNGDIDKLRYFITPENSLVREFSRTNILGANDNTQPISNLDRARIIFNKLKAENIQYLPDPNIPVRKNDRVQYAYETLNCKSGDCDDLVVLYSSLLESIGIKTAFVEVNDPQKEIAHVYLMFDSGLPLSQSQYISSNEKKFIIRDRDMGQKKIWIPVETTLITRGFEEAWETAALAYLQEAVLRNGIAEKWVKIIDIN